MSPSQNAFFVRVKGDFKQVFEHVPRATWDQQLDHAAARLADHVVKDARQRLKMLRDRIPSELSVLWRADDGSEGVDPAALYRRATNGRLVILGEAGAGKSVLIDRLVLSLRETRTSTTAPIPAIVSLSGWNPEEVELDDWIVEQLVSEFPFLVATRGSGDTTIAEYLRSRGQILPILDGFDEVATGMHRRALGDLNDVTTPLVLTSRPEAFRQARETAGRLWSTTTAELQKLDIDVITDYLASGDDEHGRRWRAALMKAPDRLGSALDTPLMVGLAREMDSDGSALELFADGERFPTAESIQAYLLQNYVPSLYGRRRSKQPRWETHGVHWLRNVAKLLPIGRKSLAWWELGDFLGRPSRVMAYFLPAVVIGFLTGAAVHSPLGGAAAAGLMSLLAVGAGWWRGPKLVRLQVGLADRTRYALALGGAGLVGGACVGLLTYVGAMHVGLWTLPVGAVLGTAVGSALTYVIRRWELGELAKSLPTELQLGAAGSATGGAALGLIFGIFDRIPSVGYGVWIGYCCLIGLSFAIPAAFEGGPRLEWSATPSDLLVANRHWAYVQMVSVGLAFSLAAATVTGRRAIPIGMAIGLAWGVGTTAWGRWALLIRWWMPLTRRLPLHVWGFLNDARKRGALRQKGPYLEFRHRRLHESLADTES
ncbi:NACHT domain-containing protein [Actinomadura spongiicola]|uniref:NACHT domain-containing protein n=1 Tax=Actinomadura spongiicola TaxID=2303421 RepID=A0A372GDV2_9ACTN|nr:NACHT domain-containing protein [Actinomadura spongiicola]RFS83558.1 NACHT domain-containing protein [Actinomadura spongiicola]